MGGENRDQARQGDALRTAPAFQAKAADAGSTGMSINKRLDEIDVSSTRESNENDGLTSKVRDKIAKAFEAARLGLQAKCAYQTR